MQNLIARCVHVLFSLDFCKHADCCNTCCKYLGINGTCAYTLAIHAYESASTRTVAGTTHTPVCKISGKLGQPAMAHTALPCTARMLGWQCWLGGTVLAGVHCAVGSKDTGLVMWVSVDWSAPASHLSGKEGPLHRPGWGCTAAVAGHLRWVLPGSPTPGRRVWEMT